MEDLSGRQFGQYRVVAALGEGGMAAVYKAYQPSVDRYVALKVLPSYLASDPTFVKRFEHEAKVIARLEHPNILPVHDFGESEGFAYLVMRYVEGGTLSDHVTGKPLPIRQVVHWVSQIAAALDYAHSHGVVHRDIKPSNVLMDKQGNCLLSDFGLAKVLMASPKLTSSGAFIGTPTYASPEQCLGSELDHRSDIYSLGVMVYEMLVGRPPYDAETPMAVVIKHVHDPLPMPRRLNPALAEAVETVILKALAKNPDDRYQSAGEFAKALATAAGISQPEAIPLAEPFQTAVLPPSPPPSPPPAPLSRPRPTPPPDQPSQPQGKRRPAAWLWALGCLGGIVILVGLLLMGGVAAKLIASAGRATPGGGLVGPMPTHTYRPGLTPLLPSSPTLVAGGLRAETPTVGLSPLLPSQTLPPLPPATPLPTPTESPRASWRYLPGLPRSINAFAWNPTNPQVVYAGAGDYANSGSGVYKSEDGGLTWQRASAGLPNARVLGLAIPAQAPDKLYAAVGDSIYLSTDGAATWTLQGKCDALSSGSDQRLFVSPDDKMMFVTGGYGLFPRSSDGGRSWMPSQEGLPVGEFSAVVNTLAFAPSDPSIVYAGTPKNGVYRSTDGGWTWSPANLGMVDYGISALAVHPQQPQVVLAGSNDGNLFSSADGGQSWNNVTSRIRLGNNYLSAILSLAFSPTDPQTVYLLANGLGLAASADGGESWQLLGKPPQQETTWFTAMGIRFDTEVFVLAGLERSGGWRYAIDQPIAQPTPTLPAALSGSTLVPAGSWQQALELPRDVKVFLVHPADPLLLFAGSGSLGQTGTAYRSRDGGQTWQQAAQGLPSNESIMALAASADGSVVYAAVGVEGAVYASRNNGDSWIFQGNPDLWGGFERRLVVAPSNPNILYAVSVGDGLARSLDAGQSWTSLNEGLPSDQYNVYVQTVAIDPGDPNVVYAGTGGLVGGCFGVYRSTDGGATWLPANQGMLDYCISSLAIAPSNPQVIYAAGGYGDVFKSVDGGQSWYNLTAQLGLRPGETLGMARALVVAPASPERVCLLGSSAGVLCSSDGGLTWQTLSRPGVQNQPDFTALALRFDPLQILVSIEGVGVWRYGLP